MRIITSVVFVFLSIICVAQYDPRIVKLEKHEVVNVVSPIPIADGKSYGRATALRSILNFSRSVRGAKPEVQKLQIGFSRRDQIEIRQGEYISIKLGNGREEILLNNRTQNGRYNRGSKLYNFSFELRLSNKVYRELVKFGITSIELKDPRTTWIIDSEEFLKWAKQLDLVDFSKL